MDKIADVRTDGGRGPPPRAQSAELVGGREIALAGGDRVLVWADVDPAALARVLKALSRP
ncbi:MAG: hypothetical protein JOZ58_02000 [Acetobacteraceae bacterium]|nr:hypothetical protein [Acetobacteraceae bacterium]MBV8573800.1 hypothetical protein [Acetobacteraceae bacterium]